MTALTQELIDRGLQLPPEDREKFANLLLDSLDDPAAERATWRAELKRRVELVASGNYTALTLEQVNSEVRRAVEEARRQ